MAPLVTSLVLIVTSTLAMAEPTPKSLAVMLLQSQVAMSPDPVVCVRLDGEDASRDVLDALRGIGKDIVAESACVGEIAGSYEKDSKRPATFVSVGEFRPTTANRAEVGVGLYRNGKWASHKLLEVEQELGKWRVIATKRHVEA